MKNLLTVFIIDGLYIMETLCCLIPSVELIKLIINDARYQPFIHRSELMGLLTKYHHCAIATASSTVNHRRTLSEVNWRASEDLKECCSYHPALLERAIVVWRYSLDEQSYLSSMNTELDDYLDYVNQQEVKSGRRRIQQYHRLSIGRKISWSDVFANNSDLDSNSYSPSSSGSCSPASSPDTK